MISTLVSPSAVSARDADNPTGCLNPRFNVMTTIIHAEIPEQLAKRAQQMVDQGWATNIESIIAESLRRYLESHQEAITQQFIREDVEWGLNGND